MHIILNNSSMIPIYEQLMDQIKANIMSGVLNTNDPLPSVRALAADLRISALTVKKAYDHLEEDGYVVTVHGKGTYVATIDPGLAQEARIKKVEEKLAEAISMARELGMDKSDILEIIDILTMDL